MTGADCFEVIPIGVIHSPYKTIAETPRQGRLSPVESTIEIFPSFVQGLRDVEPLMHLVVLYWLDRADRTVLSAAPPHTGRVHGFLPLAHLTGQIL
jgi:formylmethanofuran dehydrogenase subunit E